MRHCRHILFSILSLLWYRFWGIHCIYVSVAHMRTWYNSGVGVDMIRVSPFFLFLSQFSFFLGHDYFLPYVIKIKKKFVFFLFLSQLVWENTIKTTRTWNLKNFQATPEQTATGKGIPNPLMGVAFPKSQ